MIPVETPACNFKYHLAGTKDVGVMPCERNVEEGYVRSFWRPDELDEVIEGTGIFVRVMGNPGVIQLGLATPDASDTVLKPITPEPWVDGSYLAGAHFTTSEIEHLMGGGYFCLQVSQIPPYPVSVWIDKVPDDDSA
jgi:hypothetical protein